MLTLSVTALAILLYGASYARLTRHAIETPPGAPAACRRPGGARSPAGSRGGGAVRHVKRAVCAYTLRTLVRSRQHRMLLALYFAVALALIVSGALPLALGARSADARAARVSRSCPRRSSCCSSC